MAKKNSSKSRTTIKPSNGSSKREDETHTIDSHDSSRSSWSWFMLIFSFLQVAVLGHSLLGRSQFRSIDYLPSKDILIFHPERRFELWRYLSYSLVHIGPFHAISNIHLQLFWASLVQVRYGQLRSACIFLFGIGANSLVSSIINPSSYFVGPSGGLYALITAHFCDVLCNWSEEKSPASRITEMIFFIVFQSASVVFNTHHETEASPPGQMAAIAAGLLLGLYFLPNPSGRKWMTFVSSFAGIIVLVVTTAAICLSPYQYDQLTKEPRPLDFSFVNHSTEIITSVEKSTAAKYLLDNVSHLYQLSSQTFDLYISSRLNSSQE